MGELEVLNVRLMELRHHHCREVTGTGDDGLALYCGHPRSGRTSYCRHHRRINLMMAAVQPRPRLAETVCAAERTQQTVRG